MVAVLEEEKANRIFSKMAVKERKQLHADFYVIMEAYYESKRKTVKP